MHHNVGTVDGDEILGSVHWFFVGEIQILQVLADIDLGEYPLCTVVCHHWTGL